MSRIDTHSKKKNKKTQIILISLLAVLLLLIAGYSYRSTYYTNHFLPNTLIEETDVSNLTLKKANTKIQAKYTEAEFVITDNNQEWQMINKAEFGLQTDFSEDLQKIKDAQNKWLWGTAYVTGKTNHTLSDAAFDEEKLNEQIESLKDSLDKLNDDREPTKNASIAKGEDGFSITPEKIGDELDTTKVLEGLKADLVAGEDTLELEDFKKEPTVTSEDENLNKQLNELNKIAQLNATYTINGETFQIPTATISDWLTYEENKASVDRDKVYEYVSSLGDQYNTSTNSSSFASTLRGTVDVPAGTLSWTIATDSETDSLIEALLAGEDFTRSPISQGSADSGSPLIGSTYIEVDLVNQHMWYYVDGAVALETDIVSGKPSTPTPTGVFYVWNKERNSTLKGTNADGSKYATPVSYWMPIDWTGVGIHDSNWQPAYGGSLWETVGSHGCVNTPPSVMATLYEQVEVGTPVIVL